MSEDCCSFRANLSEALRNAAEDGGDVFAVALAAFDGALLPVFDGAEDAGGGADFDGFRGVAAGLEEAGGFLEEGADVGAFAFFAFGGVGEPVVGGFEDVAVHEAVDGITARNLLLRPPRRER